MRGVRRAARRCGHRGRVFLEQLHLAAEALVEPESGGARADAVQCLDPGVRAGRAEADEHGSGIGHGLAAPAGSLGHERTVGCAARQGEGPPRLEARRVDGPGRAQGSTGGYASAGNGRYRVSFWPTVIDFPRRGCWPLTETLRAATIRFPEQVP